MSVLPPEDKVFGPGGSFSMDKAMKQEALKDVMAYLRAVLASFKGRDQRMLGILSDFPPPADLIESKHFFMFLYDTVLSEDLKKTIKSIIVYIINPALDMFDRSLVILENVFDPNLGKRAKKIIPTKDITSLQAGDINRGFEYTDPFSSKDESDMSEVFEGYDGGGSGAEG